MLLKLIKLRELMGAQAVKVLGAFAMVDQASGDERGETDWKLLVVRAGSKLDRLYHDITDIPSAQVRVRHPLPMPLVACP